MVLVYFMFAWNNVPFPSHSLKLNLYPYKMNSSGGSTACHDPPPFFICNFFVINSAFPDRTYVSASVSDEDVQKRTGSY